VVAKVRKRLAISKQAAEKFDVERLHLSKLSELEVRKQYQITVYFLLGDSPASEIYMPTFRNTLSVPSS